MGTNARGQARREQLIVLALDAFATRGFRGVSTASIADAAGLSEPGLLHHFPTKRDLLFGVLEHYDRENGARIRERMEAGGSFRDQIAALARAHEADPTFIRLYNVLAAESLDPEHPAHEWFRERYEWLRGAMARGVADDQARGVIAARHDPEVVARSVIALLDGLQLQFLLAEEAVDIVTPLTAYLDDLR